MSYAPVLSNDEQCRSPSRAISTSMASGSLFDANMSPQGICTVEKRFDFCFVVTHRFYELSYKDVLSCT